MQTGNKNKILVTKSFLPPLKEYVAYLEKIWDNRWLTNNGPFAQELENKLKECLGVKHVFFVSNGTIAMQIALQALEIKGEVITTPFTFVATTTAILWEHCKPVFVDIDPKTFCIDPKKIEAAITPNTKAILAVHVYGYPCDVEAIEKIAKKHNLKVIYDAAHAFGVKVHGKSILSFGDISTLSLHATKLFHTGEGGLIVTNDDNIARQIKLYRSFGQEGEDNVLSGINAKNSEIHASLGLVNLQHVNEIISSRRKIVNLYKKELTPLGVHDVTYEKDVEYNHAYFPVVFESESMLLSVIEALKKENIFPRRYFYPSLNTLPYVEYVPCLTSESISRRILCLPLYHDLPVEIVKKITKIIQETVNKAKPTLTVGIPAYNEQENIAQLIHSVLSQANTNYSLRQIIVNLDGSTDDTYQLVKKLSEKEKRIKVINNSIRKGKATRLNEIYTLNNSDLLVTFDADLLLSNRDVLDKMVSALVDNPKASIAAAHIVPIKPNTFMGRIIYKNHILWDRIITKLNNGDHIANLFGGASILRKDFSKSFKYPTNISCDEEYLYCMAKKWGDFVFIPNTYVFFKAAETMRDAILQTKRGLNERFEIVETFGEKVLELHSIPLKVKIIETLRLLIEDPIFTTLGIFINFIIRVFPLKEQLNTLGIWEIAKSTKKFNTNLQSI